MELIIGHAMKEENRKTKKGDNRMFLGGQKVKATVKKNRNVLEASLIAHSLLLGKEFDEIAGFLGYSERTVKDRYDQLKDIDRELWALAEFVRASNNKKEDE